MEAKIPTDLHEELNNLCDKEHWLRKVLGEIRFARQQNTIEKLAIDSKIKDLEQKIKEIAGVKKEENLVSKKKRLILGQPNSKGNEIDIDDPSAVNQVKLNLNLNSNICSNEEVESEDSDV